MRLRKVHKVKAKFDKKLAARHSAPYILECEMKGCEWIERAMTKSVARDRRDFHERLNNIHLEGVHSCRLRTTHIFIPARLIVRELVCSVCGPIGWVYSRREGRIEGRRHYRKAVKIHASYS